MHQIIRIIVYADSKEEARDEAEQILNDSLVREGHGIFDYGTFFDDDGSRISGKARWGNMPSVVLADSKEGKKLIDEGMKFTKDAFFRNMVDIRKAVENYSDEELFEGELLDVKKKILDELDDKDEGNRGLVNFKYNCSSISPYSNSSLYLYDNVGEGIDNTSHLKKALNKWGEKNDLNIYVVPVDVHC